MPHERSLSRRDVLHVAGAGAVAGGVARGAGTAAGQEKPGFDGWLSETSNYTGVVDATGQDTVTVAVGASGNDGNFAFDPAAVRIDTGTTIVWRWTGEGSHNVHAIHGADFTSGDPTSDPGVHFERTFDETGVIKYQCDPHAPLGMKGVVVVGDVSLGGGDGGDSKQAMARDGQARGYSFSVTLASVAALGFVGVFGATVLYFTYLSTRDDAHSPPDRKTE